MTRTIRETLGHFKYVMIMAFLCVEEGDHSKLEVKKNGCIFYVLSNGEIIHYIKFSGY